ncbi:hypothetical protein FB45DRAFT_1050852 [Roridomyces roridus]|uniref:Uncharacterized protein n=1 Tax=Roridomyces roridus TaxID=1738132 RepID=A0AAD7CN11_9AGAR|nr:hypothetical protein FB45DRAFT_1050852 [Roridomyces roridus]
MASDSLAVARARVAELDKEIQHLKLSMHALCLERDQLQRTLADYKYPLLTLPTEITSKDRTPPKEATFAYLRDPGRINYTQSGSFSCHDTTTIYDTPHIRALTARATMNGHLPPLSVGSGSPRVPSDCSGLLHLCHSRSEVLLLPRSATRRGVSLAIRLRNTPGKMKTMLCSAGTVFAPSYGAYIHLHSPATSISISIPGCHPDPMPGAHAGICPTPARRRACTQLTRGPSFLSTNGAVTLHAIATLPPSTPPDT